MSASKTEITQIVSDRLEGDVADACNIILAAIESAPKGQPACLIFGGETTVNLRGDGLGGRNQELALRFALAAPSVIGDRAWVFLSGGKNDVASIGHVALKPIRHDLRYLGF
ncbi:MAG: MOFRL family protein [Albidovulum sp.]